MNKISLTDLQNFLNSKFEIDFPEALIKTIYAVISLSDMLFENAIEVISKKIRGNTYTWYKPEEINDSKTSLMYTKEPKRFQAGDYSICRSGDLFVATILKSSVEEKYLGKDKDLAGLKKRIEDYAVLMSIKTHFQELLNNVIINTKDNENPIKERIRELTKLRASLYEAHELKRPTLDSLMQKEREEILKDLDESLKEIDLDKLK